MNDTVNFINAEGLRFFGKVNASISHELKNILAIISETSGFLNDLTDLAKQGDTLKLSLLETCNGSIAEEIARGFKTIKQMNRFAHSVDVPVKEIDLVETLTLTVELTGFLSAASRVEIRTVPKEITPVLTSPFLLQNLMYRILSFAYDAAGTDNDISIEIRSEKNDGDRLLFRSLKKDAWKGFPTPKTQKAAQILGIDLTPDESAGTLDVWIPYVSNKVVELAKVLQDPS